MRVVGGVPLWVDCVFVSVVHPVAIQSMVFCVICSLMLFFLGCVGVLLTSPCIVFQRVCVLCYKCVFMCSLHMSDLVCLYEGCDFRV